MSIFKKLFQKNTTSQSQITKFNSSLDYCISSDLKVHPDLIDLLWISDGPKKNYIKKDETVFFEFEDIKLGFSSFSSKEPSLISINLPIQNISNLEEIDVPPYYPSYYELTSAQRGVYWKFLENPYENKYNIGYVFILYYGLERHLMEGNFEKSFDVILKLRDVYDNNSFQFYSACSLILTCLKKQRVDLVIKFCESLDKYYEYNFSDNLYLLCKFGLNLPLNASDITRMSKSFGFSKQNYIKNYPDLFIRNLQNIMHIEFGSNEIYINKYITSQQYFKLNYESINIFANTSLSNEIIDIPLISDDCKFKELIYNLLNKCHEQVKLDLSQMRKDGLLNNKDSKLSKVNETLLFDVKNEKSLLNKYHDIKNTLLEKHFALLDLQNFYYKYREVDKKYIQYCIDYCKIDISLLSEMQIQYAEIEKENILKLSNVYSKEKIDSMLSDISFFTGNIPAFKRLAIIYQKQKDYIEAIEICNQAIEYYTYTNQFEEIFEFENRKNKLESQISKL